MMTNTTKNPSPRPRRSVVITKAHARPRVVHPRRVSHIASTTITAAISSSHKKKGIQVISSSSFALLLLELPVKCFASDIQESGRLRFVAMSIVKGRLDHTSFDLVHRRRKRDLDTST